MRKHEINEGFLVTGLLFPLTLPPTIPLWQVAVGICFGVVIGKEIFGGTGFNMLNPALTARAFLFFAYPAQITGDNVWTERRRRRRRRRGLHRRHAPGGGRRRCPPAANVVEALTRGRLHVLDACSSGLEGGSIGGDLPSSRILLGAVILIADRRRLLAHHGRRRASAWLVIGLLHEPAAGGESTSGFTQLPFYYHWSSAASRSASSSWPPTRCPPRPPTPASGSTAS